MNKTLSVQNLEKFDFEETKKNINDYFSKLEKLKWEWAKLNAGKGVTVNYDFSTEYLKQPYIPIGKDIFCILAKENKEELLKKYLSSYCWVKSALSDLEQQYIEECFINRKCQDEIVELLNCSSNDSREFRKLKRSAVYKFADFLNLVVEKEREVLR